ncbi:MAG: DUF4160 domain-containing protein [Deltaproteobacteria bacterium]|nr:DUF4160 domain-containing protein [Deltaproteobacteria bacterium]
MAKVTAFTIPGLDLWFNSSDHIPPHFHARKPGCWEVRVFFMDCAPGWLASKKVWPRGRGGPRRQEREAILDATLAHRVELLAEWETKVRTRKEQS